MDTNKAPLFLGVGTLADFEKVLQNDAGSSPVNIGQIIVSKSMQAGTMEQHAEIFILSRVLVSGEVLYLRAEVGYYTTINVSGKREMFDPRSGTLDEREKNMRRVMEILTAWFEYKGFSWREAVIAMPENYQYLTGVLEIMRLDKDKHWVWSVEKPEFQF